MLVAPERRMSSDVSTVMAAAASISFSAFLETELIWRFITASRPMAVRSGAASAAQAGPPAPSGMARDSVRTRRRGRRLDVLLDLSGNESKRGPPRGAIGARTYGRRTACQGDTVVLRRPDRGRSPTGNRTAIDRMNPGPPRRHPKGMRRYRGVRR